MNIADRVIPTYNHGLTCNVTYGIYTDMPTFTSIPYMPQCRSVTIPKLKLADDYPYHYVAVDTSYSVYAIYCKHIEGSDNNGDGSEENPFNSFWSALSLARCILTAAACYIIQIIILPGSEIIDLSKHYFQDDSVYRRLIIGGFDGEQYFSFSGNIDLSFSGVLMQCNVNVYRTNVRCMISCNVDNSEARGYSAISCTFGTEDKRNQYIFFNIMYNCKVSNPVDVAIDSLNNSNIMYDYNIGISSMSSWKIPYVHNSYIDIKSNPSIRTTALVSDVISSTTLSGIEVSCKKLLVSSNITVKYPERIISGAGAWGVSGSGDVIVTMGSDSAISNTTITGDNKFKFTGSGRGYYGIVAVHSQDNCSISDLNVDLSTSAVELSDFIGTNQHWSVISYTCAHAVGASNPVKCVMGCDYKKVELHPEEGFDWAKPCEELYV